MKCIECNNNLISEGLQIDDGTVFCSAECFLLWIKQELGAEHEVFSSKIWAKEDWVCHATDKKFAEGQEIFACTAGVFASEEIFEQWIMESFTPTEVSFEMVDYGWRQSDFV